MQYLTPHHLAPKGLVAQLVKKSHWSCDNHGFDSHLSPEIFLQINLRTSLYASVIGLIKLHGLFIVSNSHSVGCCR